MYCGSITTIDFGVFLNIKDTPKADILLLDSTSEGGDLVTLFPLL
jgi:hypothetical protein